MSDKDLTRDQKIEKINAYRMLLKTILPIKKVEESLRTEIEGEFAAWIESRLNDLLGESNGSGSSGGFSADEVEILQGLVKQIKSRKSTPSESVPATSAQAPSETPIKKNSMAPTLSDADKARLNAVARPIRPIKAPVSRGEKSKQEDLLDHLDKMDREAPEF